MLMATFRNVLKVARDNGLIDVVPATRVSVKRTIRARASALLRWSNPTAMSTSSFIKGAKRLADEHAVVRGVEVTGELYDLVLFCVHSFVRPTSTELYALKHNDITVKRPQATAGDRAQWQDGLSRRQHHVGCCLSL